MTLLWFRELAKPEPLQFNWLELQRSVLFLNFLASKLGGLAWHCGGLTMSGNAPTDAHPCRRCRGLTVDSSPWQPKRFLALNAELGRIRFAGEIP